ncbi:MAG: hypothetical protein WC988_03715 [Patescibacteria group bacterium]
MDKLFNKIKKVRDTTHLTSDEHDQIDHAVMSFVDSQPIININQPKIMKYESPKLEFSFFGNFGKKLAYATLSVIVILSVGGGTVYASNSALPGELLYPVKVNFTEELQAAMKLSDEAKAEWAVERINRRLNELEQIVGVLNTIDPRVLDNVQKNVGKYGSETVSAAQSLNSESVSELLAKLQQASKTYSKTLGSISENFQNEKSNIALNAILDNLENAAKETNKIALSFFAEQNFFPDDENTPSNGQQNIGLITVTAPKAGTQLVSGIATTIAWVAVQDARSYEVTITHPGGEVIGLIHGQIRRTSDAPYQLETSALWPANYYHGSAPELNINKLAPGYYKIKVRAEDSNGKIYVGESANFSIMTPDEDRGILAVEIKDQNDNLLSGSRVQIESQTNKQTYDTFAESQGLAVLNHIPPGIYNVEVTPPSSYYNARFSVYIQAGKTAHRTVRVGSKSEPLSQSYEDIDDYVSPTIKVDMEDVLPDTISAHENSGQSILFARASIRPDDAIVFHRLKLGCAGDSRALQGATFVTSNGLSGQMEMRPTHGGFELEIAQKDVDLKIDKDETVTISLFLDVRDPDEAVKSGAQYPRKISCGPQAVTFASQRTGRLIPQKYFDVNALTAMRALKTTLIKE